MGTVSYEGQPCQAAAMNVLVCKSIAERPATGTRATASSDLTVARGVAAGAHSIARW